MKILIFSHFYKQFNSKYGKKIFNFDFSQDKMNAAKHLRWRIFAKIPPKKPVTIF